MQAAVMRVLAPDVLPVAQAQTVESERGSVRMWHPARTVFVNQISGIITEAIARAINALGQRIIAEDGRIIVFQDWDEVTGYDRQARVEFTRVASQLRRYTEASHFLVRSRIVTMGIQIVNVVLGNLTVQPNRRAMEEMIRATVRARPFGAERASL
jgi:hypothetical protein